MKKLFSLKRIIILFFSLVSAFHSNAEYWGPLDENRIKTVASYLDVSTKGFGEPITNRVAWNTLKANPSYSGLIGNANQYLTMTFPAWSDAAYLDYSITGNRPLGETMINNRHKWLAPVVWAECLEGNGRFLPVIKKILAEYVNEPTWVLPAHDDGLNNFYKRSYTVDLSSSKFGFEIAQTLYLLGDQIGTDLYKQVYNELNARIFNSVLTSLTTYKGNDWLLKTNNWNIVCLAGVTGAALAVVPDKNVRARFITASEKYSKNYMDGFLADGYDPEGIGYDGYSMTNFITLREVVYQSTKKNVDFFINPKVKLMAMYGPRLMIQNNVWPTIADCRWATTAADNVMWYVGRVFGIKLGAKYDTKSSFVATSDISVGCMHAFPNSASLSPNPTTVNLIGIRTYFPNAGVVVVRPSATTTAIGAAYNAGNNNESHNHNDIGSYTVVAGNQSMAGDPGGPTFYNGDVWGSARYTKYKQFSSYGHPLPIIGGATQIGGAAAVGTILGNKFTDPLDVTEMDIKSAYSIPELTTLVRKFYYSRIGSGTFSVLDSFQFTKPITFETAIPAHSAVQEISSNILKFTSNGQVLYALIEAENNPFVYTYDYINELGLQFTRVGVKLTNPIAKGLVRITYSIDHPTPAASITSSATSFCKGGSIQLSASSGTAYRWFKESLLVGTSATYNAKASGSYTVEVTYSNETKAISPAKVISELSAPTATITSPTTSFCPGGNVTLAANTGTSYVWRNGTTAVGTSSTYTAKTGGSYTVILTNASACKDTSAITNVIVNAAPIATITSSSTSFCTGDNLLLSSSAGTSYVWRNGTTTVGTVSTYKVKTEGSYTVIVANSNGCKDTSAVKTITENPLPILTHNTKTDNTSWTQGQSFTACLGDNVYTGPWPNLAAGWSWTGPNSFSSALRSPVITSITSNQAGKYTATYTDPKGCSSSLDLTIIVSVPTATITSPATSFCPGGSVALSANSGTSYVWRKGTTAVGTSSTYTAKTAGSYTVIVSDANGCKDTSVAKAISVNPVPVISITSPANNAILPTDIFPINATVTGANISNVSFYNGTSLLGTDATSQYSFTTPILVNGTYTFSAIAKNNSNCTDTAKVTVKVNKVVTGFEENLSENDNLSVSPNPFQYHFIIEKAGHFDYSISDSKGVLVESGKSENTKLLGENLSQGLYIISISSGNGAKKVSIIKQ